MLRQDAVFHRPKQRRLRTQQEQHADQHRDAAEVEGRDREAHDGDLQQFHQPDEAGFLVLVRQLADRGGKQEKRQDEQSGAQVDERIGIAQAPARGLKGDEDDQRVLVDVIIEGAEELGQKKRSETPLLQQRELVV
jgi:hypothetical protein